jgi:hypothetical protein
MYSLTNDDIRGLEYISEELAGVIFDETILERLTRMGLSAKSGESWILTERGRAILEQQVAA